MSLGEKLRSLRESRGLYQRDVCEKMGIAQNTLSGYETNKRTPTTDTLKAFAELYGTTTDQLLGSESSVSDLEEEFPEGVQVLRRATKQLSPEERKRMIQIMKAFMGED